MNQAHPYVRKVWTRHMTIAMFLMFVITSVIAIRMAGSFPKKEVICCWLIVLINAYSGAFIAGRALKHGSTGFFVWSMLINAARIGFFLIALLLIKRLQIVDFKIFALLTIVGYFVMMFGEVFSLHVQTMRGYKQEAEDSTSG
ncbi:MAG: hypothetical protein ACI9QL_004269 [Candidatus Omnitrophota bacterium]|jgi:hypothetical protein